MLTLPSFASAAAVLFDMDGVVADNSDFHHAAWLSYAREALGIELGEDAPRHFYGRTHEVIERLLERRLSPAEACQHHQGKEALYRDLARGRIRPVPGLPEYLDRLRVMDVPIALVTNSDPVCMQFVLSELGLAMSFSTCVNADDVTHAKPHPEPYLLAASRLGIEPRQCLIHEDTAGGVRAGIATGATVAAVTTTVDAEPLLAAGAQWAVPDFHAWLKMLPRAVARRGLKRRHLLQST